MFGPLPRLYRAVLGAVAVVFFVGAGTWLSHLPAIPVTLPLGATLGALAGVVVAWVLVHGDQRRPRRQSVRDR